MYMYNWSMLLFNGWIHYLKYLKYSSKTWIVIDKTPTFTDLKPVGCDNAQLGLVESNGELVPDHHPVVAAHGQQATTSWARVKQKI
jgi:hypothetical protein